MHLSDFFKLWKNNRKHGKETDGIYTHHKILYESKPLPYLPHLKEISKYYATQDEIKQVEKAINEKGYWEESYEWRISTVTTNRITPTLKDNVTWYITTVKCEQEIMIPAANIERAIVFKKLYEDFQKDLWHEQGWASNPK